VYYLMTFLEFLTVIMFSIGGFVFWKLTKLIADKKHQNFALAGAISCLIGGLPNAVDKACWTFFDYDTFFNSTWMFFFIGIGYVCLFIAAIGLEKVDRPSKDTKTLLSIVPAFHKPMKYCSMLAAAVGMTGFYTIMILKARKRIGWTALLYLYTFFMTLFLIVFAAKWKFSTPLPNIIAQTANSSGYIAFLIANKLYIKRVTR